MLMRKAAKRSGVFGVLDIGTSKTVCLIVAPPKPRRGLWRSQGPRVLGVGHAPTRGLKAGVVIDLDRAEQSVRTALGQAEQEAKTAAEGLFVAVTCGRIRSSSFEADTRIERRSVAQSDIDKLTAGGRKYAERDGRTLLHMNPIGYRLDGANRVSNPLGMSGVKLAVDLHAVTADEGPVSNLLHAIERTGHATTGVAPAPYASGLASTTEEERQLGAISIDMGAGTTTLAMFADGRLQTVDTLAVGGQHVTFDIARTLSTPFDEAERIKTLYGTLGAAASEDQGLVAYTHAGEEEPTLRQTTKAHIHGIITTRVSDLLAHVLERITRSGIAHSAAQRVILTGGASQLPGLAELAERILVRPIRVARLQPTYGLPADYCKPMFSAAIGLVAIALDPGAGIRRTQATSAQAMPGQLMRAGQLRWNGV
jgi:cell division protein FtsA